MGLPHSKTLRMEDALSMSRQRLGVRLSSAALFGAWHDRRSDSKYHNPF